MSFQETFDIKFFLLHLKFYQNFKNYHAGKLYKNLFGEYLIRITLKERFWDLSFYFCVKVHKADDSFTFIWKKILRHIFLCFYAIFYRLDPLA